MRAVAAALALLAAACATSRPATGPTSFPGSPASPADVISQARAAYRQHRDAEAEGWLRRALADRPDAPELRLALAATLVRQHRDGDARRELARVPVQGPTATRLRAALALRAGRADQAAALFATLPERDGGARLGLGVVAASRGDLASALAFLDDAARLQPGAALVYHNRALVLGRLGARTAAVADARRATQLDPYFPAARVALAGALHTAGHTGDAVAELLRARELFPDYAPARGNLGALLLLGGDATAAIRELEAAGTLAPSVPEHAFNLGLAFYRLGDVARARAAFEHVLELDPAFAPARRNLRWLDGRRQGQLIGDELPVVSWVGAEVGLAPV